MKWIEKLNKWGLTSIKLTLPFGEAEFHYDDNDGIAAWEMYVELITRAAIQKLPDNQGDERTALNSIYSLFGTAREIIKKYGRKGQSFSKLTVALLNQIVRPFTTKWHIELTEEDETRERFREDLHILQEQLRKYAVALAEIANVEDISDI